MYLYNKHRKSCDSNPKLVGNGEQIVVFVKCLVRLHGMSVLNKAIAAQNRFLKM